MEKIFNKINNKAEMYETNGLEKNTREKAESYFAQTASSTSFTAAGKFLKNYILQDRVSDLIFINTPENISIISQKVESVIKKLHPAADVNETVQELIKSGIVTEPIKEIKIKEPEIQMLETKYVSLDGTKKVEIDEDQIKIIEANLLDEEIKKANIFNNFEEIDSLISNTNILEKESNIKNIEYYKQFADAGLIEGGMNEVEYDFEAVQKLKKLFTEKKNPNEVQQKKLEQVKKIATLTERGFMYGVSELKWFGESVKMNMSSEFDDYKRGVDSNLEIIKQKEDSDILGLGIDVTFRGLESEEFKYKFFNLLSSIRDGYKTKIKYGSDHTGKLLKEFIVPKVLVYFNIEDVKEIISMLKNIENKDIQEDFKKSPLRVHAMRQLFYQCKKLSEFAHDHQNSVFRKYTAMVNSLTELSWLNTDIKEMINYEESDIVIKKLNELIVEFSKIEKPL